MGQDHAPRWIALDGVANARVVVPGVLLRSEGGLLMVRRKFEPRAGEWCLPAGFMEFGDSPETCAVRELLEETGIHGRITRLFNVYPSADDPRTRTVLILYLAERVGGTLQPGDDAIEAGFYPFESLPGPIAFHSHVRALAELRAELAGGPLRPSR